VRSGRYHDRLRRPCRRPVLDRIEDHPEIAPRGSLEQRSYGIEQLSGTDEQPTGDLVLVGHLRRLAQFLRPPGRARR
jgi:hypothetical protein